MAMMKLFITLHVMVPGGQANLYLVGGLVRAICLTLALAKLQVTNVGDLHSPEDAFSLFITDELLHQIARYTNAEGRQKAQPREQGYKDISVIELKDYLGVLIIGGTRNTTSS